MGKNTEKVNVDRSGYRRTKIIIMVLSLFAVIAAAVGCLYHSTSAVAAEIMSAPGIYASLGFG